MDIKANNIEEWVEHLKKMCDLFAQSHSYLSLTEFGCTMHNILLGVRRLENAILQVADKQRETLLNVTPFQTKKVLLAFGHIKSDISLPQSFDIDNRDEEDTTDWNALIKIENSKAPFTIGDDYEEYNKTRHYLMSSIKRHYFEAVDKIKNITNLLYELDDQAKKIETDEAIQRERYNKMQEDYKLDEWALDGLSFVEQMKEAVREGQERGKDKLDILKTELSKIRSEHLNSYMPAPVKALYKTVVNLRRQPYEALVKYRRKLSEDDISDYFSFLFRYNTLKNHIETIPLLNPVTGKYEKLFTCQAAKEYVDILRRAIWVFGGFEGKAYFGVFLLAMSDLGLAKLDTMPLVPMTHYANEMNLDDDKLRFSDGKDAHAMIADTVRKFSKVRFCELEFGDVGETGLSEDKLKEYQQAYSRYFAILNQRGLRMPKEIKVASYLKNPQTSLNLNTVMEGYKGEELRRLQFLRCALRRETLILG